MLGNLAKAFLFSFCDGRVFLFGGLSIQELKNKNGNLTDCWRIEFYTDSLSHEILCSFFLFGLLLLRNLLSWWVFLDRFRHLLLSSPLHLKTVLGTLGISLIHLLLLHLLHHLLLLHLLLHLILHLLLYL